MCGDSLEKYHQKIGDVNSSNKRLLKAEFESEKELDKKKNPAKYIDKLKNIQSILKEKYNYIRDDDDIVDQVMKVVGREYDPICHEIKSRRLQKKTIDLQLIRSQFNEVFLDLALREKRPGKGKRRAEMALESDSSEGSE